MTGTARKPASADPYRFVATLYAHEAQSIAAGLLEARREIAQAQPYISWQITPRTLTEAMAAGGAEAKRAFEAMMEMKKIDVAKIDAARRG